MSILSRIKSIISTLSFSDVEIDSVGAACDKYLNNDLHDDPTWSRLSQRDRERIKIQVQSSFQKAWRNLRVQNLKLTQKGQSVSVESLSRSQKLLQVHPAEEPDKFGEGLGLLIGCVENNFGDSILRTTTIISCVQALKDKPPFYSFVKSTIMESGARLIRFLRPDEINSMQAVMQQL